MFNEKEEENQRSKSKHGILYYTILIERTNHVDEN